MNLYIGSGPEKIMSDSNVSFRLIGKVLYLTRMDFRTSLESRLQSKFVVTRDMLDKEQ